MLRNPDDDPILASAHTGQAGYVVSLNTRDFPQGGSIAGVRYITPRDFFALLEVWYPDSPIASLTRSSIKRVP